MNEETRQIMTAKFSRPIPIDLDREPAAEEPPRELVWSIEDWVGRSVPIRRPLHPWDWQPGPNDFPEVLAVMSGDYPAHTDFVRRVGYALRLQRSGIDWERIPRISSFE